MGRPSFTLADHVLVNAASEIGVARVADPEVMAEALATFREVLPHVRREDRLIGPLAEACDEFLEHYNPKCESARMTAARFHLSAALGSIFRFKHAASRAAFIKETGT